MCDHCPFERSLQLETFYRVVCLRNIGDEEEIIQMRTISIAQNYMTTIAYMLYEYIQ